MAEFVVDGHHVQHALGWVLAGTVTSVNQAHLQVLAFLWVELTVVMMIWHPFENNLIKKTILYTQSPCLKWSLKVYLNCPESFLPGLPVNSNVCQEFLVYIWILSCLLSLTGLNLKVIHMFP